ncbi:MAG TPA: protein kinase [Polyangiaceae bacterium]
MGDRFVIEREAGSGGMGTVYAATDRVSGARVALKVLARSSATDAERFLRETRALAELDHPSIVRYVAHGTTPSGQPYLAMEWLEGEDLATRLASDGLTLAQSVRVAHQAAEALAALHRRGIVHRDVKPANVFLLGRPFDRVKLVDLGIARIRSTAATLTRAGSLVGTPGYMAPEQARGVADLSPRADVFSLGCVLFECLTGTPAFQGENVMALLAKILLVDPPRPRAIRADVPEALDELCAWMMRRDPEERPSDASAVAGALAGLDAPDAPAPVSHGARRGTPALTSSEQRLVCLLLAGDDGDQLGPTMAQGAATAELAKLQSRVTSVGVRIERLADGSLLGVAPRDGSATEQAVAAARAALLVRAEMPSVPVALATGRGDVSSPVPVGDVIDRAARLYRRSKRADAPRPIVIDEVTSGLLSERFEIATAGDAHVLVSELPDGRTGARTVLGRETPFVGRARELAMLEALVAECTSESTARAVVVTAPAGVGKSRLRRELVARARATLPSLEIWTARGDPMQTGAPFALLARALRDATAIAEGESAESSREKIRARVLRSGVADGERVIAFACELLGVAQAEDRADLAAARREPHLMHDQLRTAWLAWLDAETRARPVMLVLEDLQWGDAPTVSFVDDALRVLGERPLFVLAVARPEIENVFPRVWAERNVQPVPLRELSKSAAETLARHVLGPSAPPAVVAGVVSRAAGNAFFLEELLRASSERGARDLPETVLAMVESRLDALDPDARRVLRAASVFGETFHAGGVAALLGDAASGVRLDEWLALLARKEMILARETSSVPGETELVFRHALVREAAYAMLTEKDRALGHALAGAWLESKSVGDAALLAEHFARGGERVRAASFFASAARHALGANDPLGALDKASRGLELAGDDETRTSLLSISAEAHLWRADLEGAERAATAALARVAERTDPWWNAIGTLVEATTKLAHVDRANELAAKIAAALETTAKATPAAVRAATSAAHVGVDTGRYETSAEVLAWAAAHVDDGDTYTMGSVQAAHARLSVARGDIEDYCRRQRAAASAFEAAGAVRDAAHAMGGYAYGALLLGLDQEAETAMRRSRDLSASLDARGSLMMAEHNLGLILLRLGRPDEALALETSALEAARAQKSRRMEAGCLYYLSLIAHARGDHVAAEAYARESAEVAAALPPSLAEALAALAQACLAQGKNADARAASDRAMAIVHEVGSIDEGEPFIRLTHALVLRAAGEAEASREAIVRAATLVESRAARISDPESRASFLAVSENARILDLARAGAA